jgi:hypothetical protein
MIGEGTAAAAAGRRGGRDDRSRRNRIAAIEASILFYLFLPLAIDPTRFEATRSGGAETGTGRAGLGTRDAPWARSRRDGTRGPA